MYYNNLIIGYSDHLFNNHLNNSSFNILLKLSSFLKENNISFYLLTGMMKDVGEKVIEDNKINLIFDEKHIFHVDKKYLDSLSEIDREIRFEKFNQNSKYVDEYFKIYFLNKLKPEINNGKTLFVGQDIWTDAYYIVEYSKINILLLKPNIYFNKEKYLNELKTIPTINLSLDDLSNFLKTKKDFDYTPLKSFAKNYLISKTIGKINLNVDYKKLYKK
jgi:hypothetical protein